uniref:Cytochrome c-type biogenesis protein CcmE n=1 Tax=Candidatus Kentrum eta TaxID=2126337 RepID=A0A450UYL0_9GAMM|nr:MAG: cytochrome c-type biogenesis protein CcmE [Candidatus Kentron sp. H]VFJ98179.1 MAG: cytochrome c-type biogenesis protein CcmE [Candidatus Kentron sp. H]VFK03231.1 MAG: cytochrome c-type biogenesis protein CcmE [Candidatus Kentron sp. H]
MKRQSRHQLFIVIAVVVGISAAAWLVFSAFQDNMRYFVSPSEIHAGLAPEDHTLRVGGLVVAGSVHRPGENEGLTVEFELTDNAERISVAYTGILPDLFREGQGIVATGRLRPDGVFAAREVLAKHDENYMPREVQAALDKAEDAAGVGKALRESAGGSL